MIENSNHYKLRKLTVGLVSVCAGVLFMTSQKQVLHASTVNTINNNPNTNTQEVQNTQNQKEVQQTVPALNQKQEQKAVVQPVKSNLNLNKANNPKQELAESKISNSTLNLQENSNNKSASSNTNSNEQVLSREKLALRKTDNANTAKELAESKAVNNSLPVSNTNDAFALDPKNGMHEHANVNDNGGYDEDFWGKIDCSKWNVTKNGDDLIIGYKDETVPKSLIVPNLADFKLAGLDQNAKNVILTLSSKFQTSNIKYFGISKTNNCKVLMKSIDFNSINWNIVDLNSLDVSNINNMLECFYENFNLTSLNISEWDTRKVTDMNNMFANDPLLTNLDISKWNTSNVTNMNCMFEQDTALTNLNISNWDTSNVTNMIGMFAMDTALTDLNLSNWKANKLTSGQTQMMFYNTPKLELTINSGSLADYFVKNQFDSSNINDSPKAVITDNQALIKLLTNDKVANKSDPGQRVITITFPASYTPDANTIKKLDLVKTGDHTYTITQWVDFQGSLKQAYININNGKISDDGTTSDSNIADHHIDVSKSTFGNYLPVASTAKGVTVSPDGKTATYNAVPLPKIPGYTPQIVNDPITRAFAISFVALPKKPDNKPAKPNKPSNMTKPSVPVKPVNPVKPVKQNSRSNIDYNTDNLTLNELHLVNENDLEVITAKRIRALTKQQFSPVYHGKKIDIKHVK